jgi:hypothetical protein
MSCILVMDKNADPNSWVVSAQDDCDALKALSCYQEPPLAVVPKASNPASAVATVSIPSCRGGAPERGTIYSLTNG